MFDLTTILTLLAPAVIAPLGCLVFLKAIARAETARRETPAPHASIVRESAAAPVSAEAGRARQAA